jgi:hypothetical protein
MLRCSTLIATFFFLLAASAPAREAAPFRAGGGPDAKKSAPENPQRIIEEIRSHFDRVGSDFEKNQPGAETRKAQQRILDGIDKLLEQQDPEPKNSKAPPTSKNSPPSNEPAVKPKPALEKPKITPATPKSIADLPKEIANTAKTTESMAKSPTGSGYWPNLPPRHRDQIDALSRERFIRNYSEILREYYRALAEEGTREKRD